MFTNEFVCKVFLTTQFLIFVSTSYGLSLHKVGNDQKDLIPLQVAIDLDENNLRYREGAKISELKAEVLDIVEHRRFKRSSYKVKTKFSNGKVKYKTKYKFGGTKYETKVKYSPYGGYKHKIKIKMKGGHTGRAFGLGLLAGGIAGAAAGYYVGKYGRHQFVRNGHVMVLFTPASVPGFVYIHSPEHNHFHDIHGHYLGHDGVYHMHFTDAVVHDAYEHIPIQAANLAKLDYHNHPVTVDGYSPMFRYYPLNETHGIWEYSAQSVALTLDDHGSATASKSSLLLIFVVTTLACYFNPN